MAQSLNKVLIIGRLGKDPEVKEFDGGRVVNFSVATSEDWRDKQTGEKKQRTHWHNVAVWNDALGEVAERFLKKGSLVYLEGQLETRSWGSGADKKYATEVVLRPFGSDLQMLDKAPDRPESGPAQRQEHPAARPR